MASNKIINVNLFGEEIGRIGIRKRLKKIILSIQSNFFKKQYTSKYFSRYRHNKRIDQVRVFSQFDNETFKGIPPQFADSLPDMFQ